MAPFCFVHCVTCGRQTKHWHDCDPSQTLFWGVCEECGLCVITGPKADVYWVAFTNVTDLSAEPSAGQYYLATTQKAASAAEALDAALPWALGVNRRVGLPPHGIRVSEEELRRQATVMPDKDVFRDGYVAVFNRHG